MSRRNLSRVVLLGFVAAMFTSFSQPRVSTAADVEASTLSSSIVRGDDLRTSSFQRRFRLDAADSDITSTSRAPRRVLTVTFGAGHSSAAAAGRTASVVRGAAVVVGFLAALDDVDGGGWSDDVVEESSSRKTAVAVCSVSERGDPIGVSRGPGGPKSLCIYSRSPTPAANRTTQSHRPDSALVPCCLW